ncbi:MAG: DUF3388 domain-containing protein [Clostridia bacterium]|nr:DUF3388 domain-containing protein [Clostridia bacterium]
MVYLEYRILTNRPGLLGDITSLIGLLNINICQVSGVSGNWRGFLLDGDEQKINALKTSLTQIDNIEITAIRTPGSLDRIAIKHGTRLSPVNTNPLTYSFVRDELGLLIDFLGEILKETGNIIIGIRGMPRVGKTEASIAGCVNANKRWVLVSSTIIRQNLRNSLAPEESSADCVLLIDGISTTSRGGKRHNALVKEILQWPVPKIIEHPDVFVRDGSFGEVNFDWVIELRRQVGEEINYQDITSSFSAFDIS